ncbi:MAG: DnaB-like helicase C-terminal domain-containing protein, partial [Candidatus Subteraquimicrobiales bacterium]|nr:DnaB-like helicase C-terminal domain-containing protein [Candidatus Subteraquimicrobiales bacterium]
PLLILTLDNDTAGISAADELSAQFMALGFEHSKPILPKWYEDANQSLKLHTSDFRALLSDLAKTEQKQEAAMQKKTENQPKLPEKAKASNVNNNLDFFFTGTCNDNPISTGFSNLDDLLDGGLREGLYIIGAGSALGKTTFCLQLANRAAASGQSVAFLSLEQSRQELIAKTLSMLTYADPSNGGQEVCTAREVKRYALLPPGNKKALNNAKEKLTEYGNNLFIYEIDDQDQSVSELVLSHELETGSAPAVLIIDYLQIMKPSRIGITSDKQIIDANVHELRQLARRHKIPIIAISSLNRIAYDQGLSFKSFKESGGIEYSSDLLLGLQPKGSRQDSTMDDFLRNDSREMELVLLKNRNGSTGKCQFMFKAKYNFFKEMQ